MLPECFWEALLKGQEIGNEIWDVWQKNSEHFCIHPAGASIPLEEASFRRMFQFESRDANTASVVSSALGIPIAVLTAGK